jgi:hypothetical protein
LEKGEIKKSINHNDVVSEKYTIELWLDTILDVVIYSHFQGYTPLAYFLNDFLGYKVFETVRLKCKNTVASLELDKQQIGLQLIYSPNLTVRLTTF